MTSHTAVTGKLVKVDAVKAIPKTAWFKLCAQRKANPEIAGGTEAQPLTDSPGQINGEQLTRRTIEQLNDCA